MRQVVLVAVVASLIAGCGATALSPSTPASNAVQTAMPTGPGATLGRSGATSAPPSVPTLVSASPQSAPPQSAPPPTPKPKAGWPTVTRAGVTMTGDASDVAGPMDGSLRLQVTVAGLTPGEALDLDATGEYVVKWICGTEPEPCGELGCAPAFSEQAGSSSKSITTAVAGNDGIAAFEVELAASPRSGSCPADPSAAWRTQWERWTKVRVTDRVHGLRLTPGALEYGETY